MAPLVDRLLGEQLSDGGWNCEVENGATVSSFATTINVLEGLLAHEAAIGGSTTVALARRRGEEYMLERRLFRRKSTGEVIDPTWLQFSFPHWWFYDVLRALEYMRAAGVHDDDRLAEAIAVVEANRIATAAGRSRMSIPASRPSTWMRAKADRADGTRFARCASSTGSLAAVSGDDISRGRHSSDPHPRRCRSGASRAWYTDVLGATVYREYAGSVVLSFGAAWLLLVEGGRPTDDKPDVTLAPPADPSIRDNLFTIRVDDCRATYELSCVAAAARFSPNRVSHGYETRCFLRDPDGHLFEISEYRPSE